MIRPSELHLEKIIGLILLFLATILFISSSLFAFLMLVLFLVALTGYFVRSYGLIIFSQEPSPVPNNAAEGDLPAMSVMIPLHNEELVVAETMRKMVSLDYPDRNITIVFILDNCTDRTEAVLDEAARDLRFSPMDLRSVENPTITRTKRYQNPEGRTIDLIIRDANIGGKGKAAALNAAFGINNADIVGFYDADHRPDPGNAKRAVQWLSGDKSLGCIQGSCYIMNGSMNILTGLVFFEYAALNRVEQPAKSVYDGMVCFEGANGFFRREAIEKGGGFDPDNLAEDTYLSFKLADLGYRIAFDPEIRSCEQCPENLKSWYQQRLRWARGWFQCAGHNLFRVGNLNLLQRCEGEYLLLSGMQSILIMFFLLLYPLTILYYSLLNLADVSEYIPLYQYNPFISFGFIIPFFYALAIITPILQVTVGAALLSDELPGFMRKNRKNVVVLFIFPLYSVMHGLVALFAFVEQFILRKPGIWVKTPRSQADSIEFGRENE